MKDIHLLVGWPLSMVYKMLQKNYWHERETLQDNVVCFENGKELITFKTSESDKGEIIVEAKAEEIYQQN